jgi:hypothetical protein
MKHGTGFGSCAPRRVPDKTSELESEEAAQAFITMLQSQMQERAPDTI